MAMGQLIVLAMVVDCAAVAALAWLVGRVTRERDAILAEQRTTMERLRGDIAQLLDEAEVRARAVERSLAPSTLPLGPLGERAERRDRPTAPERQSADPAEARLLRELELRFAKMEMTE
jgi:hypothetical protein